MNISDIGSILSLGKSNQVANNSLNPQGDNQSFGNILNDAMKELNQTQVDGYNAMEGIATGKVTNLQEAVQKIESAELSLKLGLEVKNKAISAYKEIMRMQV